MASGTRRNAICHPPCANVVAQMKNILAFTMSKKNTLFCKSEAQNLVCAVSSLLSPRKMIPSTSASPPTPSSMFVHFLYPAEISNCCLIIPDYLIRWLFILLQQLVLLYYLELLAPKHQPALSFLVLF